MGTAISSHDKRSHKRHRNPMSSSSVKTTTNGNGNQEEKETANVSDAELPDSSEQQKTDTELNAPDTPAPPEPKSPPDFSDDQRKLVCQTWTDVEKHIAKIGLTAFLELFRKNPESSALFGFLKHLSNEDLEFYSQLQNHAIRVTGVLSMLVKQLEQPREEADVMISEFLSDLGRRHFSYGSRPHQMELLGRLFVDSLTQIFPNDERTHDIEQAWLTFFSVIVFWMQSGYCFVKSKGSIEMKI